MKEKEPAPMCAAIDVGSNTIHIVVARCLPATLEIVADELELVRIGESVTATGAISPEKFRASIRTLREYRALAERYGAERIFVVATEAIRQASNSADFVAQVREETGLEMLLINGTAEATLTFFGSTYEAPSSPRHQEERLGPAPSTDRTSDSPTHDQSTGKPAPGQQRKAGIPEQVSVMDLGGGSLELVFAWDMRITWRTSIPVGSGWLHDRYLAGDPPTSDEIETAEAFLQTYLQEMTTRRRAPLLIVTGGSANSLMGLVQKAFHRPGESRLISLADLLRCQWLLSALETKDVVTFYSQPPARARILQAGTLIIRHMMMQLQVAEILVSSHGIREGVLLAYARYGERWLEEVSREEIQHGESFALSAQRMLVERLHNMLEWPAEVLKHEDIEAVHKMRVASRRLRAALDAYQACCDPVLFAKIYRKIKQAADALGEARDADVQIHSLREQLAGLSTEERVGVRWLLKRLQAYRQQKQRKLEAALRKLNEKKLENQLKKSLERRGE